MTAHRDDAPATGDGQPTADTAKPAARSDAAASQGNPLAIIAGGLVIGVALAALLPSHPRERALLSKARGHIGQRVRDAASAAKQAGVDQFDFGGDVVRDQAQQLIHRLTAALTAAAQAAMHKLRDRNG